MMDGDRDRVLGQDEVQPRDLHHLVYSVALVSAEHLLNMKTRPHPDGVRFEEEWNSDDPTDFSVVSSAQ